jgi:tRNA pseudouridine38-40 synthase
MRQLKLTLHYDGTNYRGWQVQAEGTTIQGLLQETVQRITGEAVTVIGAGRTDAGVHALAQVASFTTASAHLPEVFLNALNALLPDDIRVMGVAEVAASFHPRFSALRKSYLYFVSSGRIISPFLHRYAWKLHAGLDLAAMRKALEAILGTHDFSSFRGSGCGAKTTIRTILAASIERTDTMPFLSNRLDGTYFAFRIEGDAFLRHMVRNLVGTLVEIGKGKMDADALSAVLEAKDRTKAGPTAPARGLFLERIVYQEDAENITPDCR